MYLRLCIVVCVCIMLKLGSTFRLQSAFNSRVFNSQRYREVQRYASSVEPPKAYDHLAVEAKWQRYWDEHQTFKAIRRPGAPKKYVLDMFPYPSGAGLHVGHPEGYTATDIMARFWRMRGFDVLHPMGWDAFGLPAEQHAINTGTHPAVTTYTNIATFKRQLKSLGFSYDWSRELATTDNGYVKWTQWIFLQLLKAGLAEQQEVTVNWCPALGTVLANEEIINGLSERGNHPVTRLPLRQWVLKITDYADRLEEGLAGMDWPEGTLSAQRQWIGRSEGASIQFPILNDHKQTIEVFTTRPDTLMGVTYLVLAPEHPLATALTSSGQRPLLDQYRQSITGKSDLERTSTGKDKGKSGLYLGFDCVHPLTGEKIPVWAADYVLGGYGTGAVMAVPAHDERDFAFANQFHLPIKQVIAPSSQSTAASTTVELPYLEEEGTLINSGPDLNGQSPAQAMPLVISQLSSKGLGKGVVNYKLRDWVFSRQRYWGEPIPVYFPVELAVSGGSPIAGDEHKIRYDQPIAVDESDLPLTLPKMTDFQPGDDPLGCLARAKDWRYFQNDDGQWYARETNTMPQWAGSCWYYLRFTDPLNSQQILSSEAASWLPVDLYVGGQEHAVLHLLYARFWHMALYDMGLVKDKEPFTKLVHQGMILGSDGEKMSKSRGNVINPDDVVNEHGADALRLYEMFMGPLEATKPWQTAQLAGVVRFRERVHSLITTATSTDRIGDKNSKAEGDLQRDMHRVIKKVTGDIDRLGFNTAISALMVYTTRLKEVLDANCTANKTVLSRDAVEALVLLLSPFAPHVAEECWQLLGHATSLAHHAWPTYDDKLCEDTVVTVAVQVNGKVRGKVDVSKTAEQAEAMSLAMAQTGVSKWVTGGETAIKKVIYVPGRILNIII